MLFDTKARPPVHAAASRAFPEPLRRGTGHDIFRLPAFAFRSSDSRRGIGPSSRSAYRTKVRTSTGLPRSTRTSYDRGGCLLYPEDGGAPPGQDDCLTGACRFSAASPCTQLRHPIGWALLYEASTGVHAIHPSGHSPHLWPPGWNGPPLGFPPSFEPRPAEPDDARRGGDRPSSTDLAQRLRHQPNLQSCVSTRSVRPRVASR